MGTARISGFVVRPCVACGTGPENPIMSSRSKEMS